MVTIRPNQRGREQVMVSAEAKRAIDNLAETLADRVQVPMVEGIPGDIELPIKVSKYRTDRARATVWLAHPSGLAVQAKHGSLTQAASSLGLEVQSDD